MHRASAMRAQTLAGVLCILFALCVAAAACATAHGLCGERAPCAEIEVALHAHPHDPRVRALAAHGLVVDRARADEHAAAFSAYASEPLLALLRRAGVEYTVRNETARRDALAAAGYHDSEALEAVLRDVARAHPALVRVTEIGRTVQGRPLLVASVGSVPGTRERVAPLRTHSHPWT